MIPLVSAAGLSKQYATTGGAFLRRQTLALRALDGVDLDIMPGETLGLVGESGCGKSTLGRTLIRLIEPTCGTILFDGADITALDMKAMRSKRRAAVDPRRQGRCGDSRAGGGHAAPRWPAAARGQPLPA